MSLPWESVAPGKDGLPRQSADWLAMTGRGVKYLLSSPAHPAGIVRKNTYFGNYGESLSKIGGAQTADSLKNVVLRRTVVQINKNSG